MPISSHQSSSEWLRLANFAQFTTFPIFSHQMINSRGGGGKWPNANCEHQTTKWKYPNLPTTNDQFHGRGVNYLMQIMIKLPNGTKVAQNDSEQPILPNSQLFQSFPTKVAQNDSEQPISPNSQLFWSFPTEVAQNDSERQFHPIQNFANISPLEWPILPDSQLFQSFPTKWSILGWRGR